MKTILKLIVPIAFILFLTFPSASLANGGLYGAASCSFDRSGKSSANLNLFGRYTKKGIIINKIYYRFPSGSKNNIRIGTEKDQGRYLKTPDLKGKEGIRKVKPFLLPKVNKQGRIKVFFVLDKKFASDPICTGTLYIF